MASNLAVARREELQVVQRLLESELDVEPRSRRLKEQVHG